MPDAPTFCVVQINPDDIQNLADGGDGAYVYPKGMGIEAERVLLVRLGDLPAPGQMGETREGVRYPCHRIVIYASGQVATEEITFFQLVRRAPPEPTWQEDVETIKARAVTADSEIRAALARIEKRLAGGSDG